MKMLYKYPQVASPYDELVQVNEQRKQANRNSNYSTRCMTAT